MEQIGLQAIMDTSSWTVGVNQILADQQRMDKTANQLQASTKGWATADQGLFKTWANDPYGNAANQMANLSQQYYATHDASGKLLDSTKKLTDEQKAQEAQSKKVVGGLTSIVKSTLGVTSVVAVAISGIKLLIDTLKEEMTAAIEYESTMIRVNATIASTGRTGEISASQISEYGKSMSGLFATTEIEEAANVLMRYMDIPSEKIPEILSLTENMAAALGKDLPTAAQQLGMALETGRLRGLGFSREMQSMISDMMTAGDIAQADAIIIDELSKKYSGQATAALKGYGGQLQANKAAYKEMHAAHGQMNLRFIEQSGILQKLTKSYQVYAEKVNAVNRAQELGLKYYFNTDTNLIKLNGHTVELEKVLEDIAIAEEKAAEEQAKLAKETETGADAAKFAAVEWEKFQKAMADTTDAIEKDLKDQAKQWDDYKKAIEEAMKGAQEAISSRTTWEASYTGMEKVEDRWKATLDLIGSSLQKTAGGAAVWEQFLGVTGGIDQAAIDAYAKVQYFLAKINEMIAAGVPPERIAGIMNASIGYLNDQSAADLTASVTGWILKGIKDSGDPVKAWWNENSQTWFFGDNPNPVVPPEIDTATLDQMVKDAEAQFGNAGISEQAYINQYIADTATYQTQVNLRITAEEQYQETLNKLHDITITITAIHKDVYESYGPQGQDYAGGYIPPGGEAYVGDAPNRPTGYEEIVKVLPEGGAIVTPAHKIPIAPESSGNRYSTVNVYANVGNGIDIEKMAYKIAAVIKRRQ